MSFLVKPNFELDGYELTGSARPPNPTELNPIDLTMDSPIPSPNRSPLFIDLCLDSDEDSEAYTHNNRRSATITSNHRQSMPAPPTPLPRRAAPLDHHPSRIAETFRRIEQSSTPKRNSRPPPLPSPSGSSKSRSTVPPEIIDISMSDDEAPSTSRRKRSAPSPIPARSPKRLHSSTTASSSHWRGPAARVTPPPSPPAEDEDEESDDTDSDYDTKYLAFDIIASRFWKEFPMKSAESHFDPLERIPIAEPTPLPRRLRPDISNTRSTPSSSTLQIDLINLNIPPGCKRLTQRHPLCRLPNAPMPNSVLTWERSFRTDFDLRMKYRTSKEATDTINCVEQQGAWTVVASSVPAGDQDQPGVTPTRNAYNERGGLLTFDQSVWRRPKAHEATFVSNTEGNTFVKYYDVKDVKFAQPSNSKPIFVSIGTDKMIRTWSLGEVEENSGAYDDNYSTRPGWLQREEIACTGLPLGIAFMPNSSLYAVSAGNLWIHDAGNGDTPSKEYVLSRHLTGGMAWGANTTQNYIFASSEPTSAQRNSHSRSFSGVHSAVDTQAERVSYTLDADGEGDVICVDDLGDRLALVTLHKEFKHTLRIFDVRSKCRRPQVVHDLAPFDLKDHISEPECTMGAFSPDGMYLALGRLDNQVHVYDSRMLASTRSGIKSKALVMRCEHDAKDTSGGNHYGVVKVRWLREELSGRMALVSGGEDGHIRIWNPDKSASNPENGRIIATSPSDVADFSVGDPHAGEHRLVVGGCECDVTIFDNVI